MGRKINDEKFIYVRPLDNTQIRANKFIINSRYDKLYKYTKINNGSRVTVVDEYGREYKGKMDKGKNTYLHCLEWYRNHPDIRDGSKVLFSITPDQKKRVFVGDLSNTHTLSKIATDLPVPPKIEKPKKRRGRQPKKKRGRPPKKGKKKSKKGKSKKGKGKNGKSKEASKSKAKRSGKKKKSSKKSTKKKSTKSSKSKKGKGKKGKGKKGASKKASK